jgi:hypothetical protein
MEIRGQLHTQAIYPPGGGERVPNEQEAQWALEPVWKVWSTGTSPVPHKIRALDLPARSLMSTRNQQRLLPWNRKAN